jgi:hypothetical protein
MGGVVVLVVAGWAGMRPGGQTPTPSPSASSEPPVANVAVSPSSGGFPSQVRVIPRVVAGLVTGGDQSP